MNWLVLLLVSLQEQSSGMDGIHCSISLHKTILVGDDVNNAMEVAIDDVLKNLHSVAEQANQLIVSILANVTLALPNGHHYAGGPGLGRCIFVYNVQSHP